MTSMLEKYLIDAMQNQAELDALNLIDNSIAEITKIQSQVFQTRKAKLEALVEPGKKLRSAANTIQEIDAKRVSMGIAPSYSFVDDKPMGLCVPDKEPTPAKIDDLSQEIVSIPQMETGTVFGNDESEFVLLPYKRKAGTRILEEEEEEEEDDDDDDDDDDNEEDEEEDDGYKDDAEASESSEEISEDADEEGIVSDDQPIKVHRPDDEDASDDEVMNFDPCRLDKRSRRPSIKARESGEFFKIRGDGTYSLRSVKPEPTEPEAMIKAALSDKNMRPIEKWVESEIFQNKGFMTFGPYETKKSKQAYQRLLRLAKSGRLKFDTKITRERGVCMLCQSTKSVSWLAFDGRTLVGEVGADCHDRFSLAFQYCQFITALREARTKVRVGSDLEFLRYFDTLQESVTLFLEAQEKKSAKNE